VRIAPGFAGRAPHVIEALRQFVRRNSDEVRKPRVAVYAGATLRQFAFAADPNGNPGFLERLGAESDIIDIVMLTMKIYVLVLPELVEELELFVRDLASLFERRAQGSELFIHPADTHSHNQSSDGQLVDGRGDLGPIKRMAIGHHHNAHAQLDLFRA